LAGPFGYRGLIFSIAGGREDGFHNRLHGEAVLARFVFLALPVFALLFFPNYSFARCEHFIGTIISDGVSDMYSLAQLYNPKGSGKNLEVSRIDIAVTAWGQTPPGTRAADLVVQLAPLENEGGNATCKDLSSEAPSAARMYDAAFPPIMVTGFRPIYEFWMGGAENDHSYTFNPPLIIPPGKGLAVRGGQKTMYVVTSWQWAERERTPDSISEAPSRNRAN
jgi:hypothetical protein